MVRSNIIMSFECQTVRYTMSCGETVKRTTSYLDKCVEILMASSCTLRSLAVPKHMPLLPSCYCAGVTCCSGAACARCFSHAIVS